MQPLLVLFTESLGVRFAVRIEEFLAALLPCCFEFGRGDVPVRPAFSIVVAGVVARDRRFARGDFLRFPRCEVISVLLGALLLRPFDDL